MTCEPQNLDELALELLLSWIACSPRSSTSTATSSPIYGWQRQLLDNLSVALEATSGKRGRKEATRERELEGKVAELEARLVRKDNVIASARSLGGRSYSPPPPPPRAV